MKEKFANCQGSLTSKGREEVFDYLEDLIDKVNLAKNLHTWGELEVHCSHAILIP